MGSTTSECDNRWDSFISWWTRSQSFRNWAIWSTRCPEKIEESEGFWSRSYSTRVLEIVFAVFYFDSGVIEFFFHKMFDAKWGPRYMAHLRSYLYFQEGQPRSMRKLSTNFTIIYQLLNFRMHSLSTIKESGSRSKNIFNAVLFQIQIRNAWSIICSKTHFGTDSWR